MTDSVLLSGPMMSEEDDGSKSTGTGILGQGVADAQVAWIESVLERSEADHIWLTGHYPVYSGCRHGND